MIRSGPDLATTLHPSISAISPAEWEQCLPGEAEGWHYYAACESCVPRSAHPVAVSVTRGGGTVAVAPLFHLQYRLDTPLQGLLRRFTDALGHINRDLFALELLGLGSPLADRCPIGFVPELAPEERAEALRCMLEAIEAYARGAGIGLTIIKDLPEKFARAMQLTLERSGYARLQSLPVAVLDLAAGEHAYFAKLSRATRKDVRRKLARSRALTIETTSDIEPLWRELHALYESTREHSGVDYGDLETLPAEYFRAVSRIASRTAVFKLYRVNGRLIGFNLLLVGADRLIDKFLGMEYPAGPEHGLYMASWMENVRHCIGHNLRYLETGQTAYGLKLRLGSALEPSVVCFRHRSRLMNLLLKALAPWFAFDRHDPELAAYRRDNSP
jgi:hypothetical protein